MPSYRSAMATVATFLLSTTAGCGGGTGSLPVNSPRVSSEVESGFNSSTITDRTGGQTMASPPNADQASSATSEAPTEPAPLHGSLKVSVLNELPHDPTSFTQGLEYHEGRLLESRGLRGQSSRAWINTTTGLVESTIAIDDHLFAEGITAVGNRFVQLTYTSGQLLSGELDALESTGPEISYTGEGWGLCYDGEQLIKSNGSHILSFHNPLTFEQTGSVPVLTDDGSPVVSINELECVGSQVIANVWGWEKLLVIDASSGAIDAVVDASNLRPSGVTLDLRHALNGIAADQETNTYYLTGKLWPTIFHVEFVAA